MRSVGLSLTVPNEGHKEVRSCQAIINTCFNSHVIRGHPVGRRPGVGEIVYLHFLGVSVSRLLTVARSS
jgi:hypothetical protein